MGSNLFVASKGHCFLCLKNVPYQLDYTTQHKFKDNVAPTQVISLLTLSRYLKIGKKQFQAEKSNLNVELCPACACVIEQFQELCIELEKIELEVISVLNIIKEKLTDKSKERLGASSDPPIYFADCLDQLDSFQAFRKEVLQKCLRTLATSSPRVKLRILLTKEISYTYFNFSTIVKTEQLEWPAQICESDSLFEATDVKIEHSFQDSPLNNRIRFNSGHSNKGNSHAGRKKNSKSAKTMGNTSDTNTSSCNVVRSNPEASPSNSVSNCIKTQNGKEKCVLCQEELYNNRSAKHFRRIHLNERYLCGKEFSRLDYYYKHHRFVQRGIGFKCNICNKMFATKDAAETHQRKARCQIGVPVIIKPICPQCVTRFTKNSQLLRHIREVHSQLRKHQCTVCRKTFKRARYVKTHMSSEQTSEKNK